MDLICTEALYNDGGVEGSHDSGIARSTALYVCKIFVTSITDTTKAFMICLLCVLLLKISISAYGYVNLRNTADLCDVRR